MNLPEFIMIMEHMGACDPAIELLKSYPDDTPLDQIAKELFVSEKSYLWWLEGKMERIDNSIIYPIEVAFEKLEKDLWTKEAWDVYVDTVLPLVLAVLVN